MTLQGIPIFVHVSLPIGGVWFSMFGGFDARNSIYYCIGYVHNKGGVLIALPSMARAVEVAAAITAERSSMGMCLSVER